MPQPRKYKNNAERQKAYRERKKAAASEAAAQENAESAPSAPELVRRILDWNARQA